jgi:zinc transporter ZupT
VSLGRLDSPLKWAVFGGVFGGLMALVGYFILSPETDSLILFVLLRALVGAVVAALVAPLVARMRSSTR